MDLSTREGRRAHLESEWKVAAKQKEQLRLEAIEWYKTLEVREFEYLLYFTRNPEELEKEIFK